MRILRVAQKTYPAVKGGGPYHVHAMSRDQATMGHDVTVLTVNDAPKKPHLEKRDGYTVIRYGSRINVLGNDLSTGVAQYLKYAESFDVIHAHSHLYFSTNLAALKRRLGNIPLAITNHGLYSQTAPEWVFNWYLRSVGQWTFNQADVIFCYTKEDKQRIREFDIKSEIKVVPNGIDVNRFTPEGPTSDLIDHDGPTILFVGRLVEGKRPIDAIAAVEQVRQSRADVKLYICGEGPLHKELRNRSSECVEFLGHVAYEEMPNIYRSADVLVLPSRAEGLPRTVLEAIASGVNVVTSDLEQLTPLIDGYGYTAPVGDVEAFTDRIERILEEDTTTSEDGIQRELSWERTVRETTSALRQLTESQ